MHVKDFSNCHNARNVPFDHDLLRLLQLMRGPCGVPLPVIDVPYLGNIGQQHPKTVFKQ